jgi:hypothetical protein
VIRVMVGVRAPGGFESRRSGRRRWRSVVEDERRCRGRQWMASPSSAVTVTGKQNRKVNEGRVPLVHGARHAGSATASRKGKKAGRLAFPRPSIAWGGWRWGGGAAIPSGAWWLCRRPRGRRWPPRERNASRSPRPQMASEATPSIVGGGNGWRRLRLTMTITDMGH